MQVVLLRKQRQPSLGVVSPWDDQISAQYSLHPALVAIERVQSWKRDLASGARQSLRAIATHENLTVARVSQMMVLAHLSQPAVDRLHDILAYRTSPKEASSLRKLFRVARFPAEAQVAAIENLGRRRRLRQAPSVT